MTHLLENSWGGQWWAKKRDVIPGSDGDLQAKREQSLARPATRQPPTLARHCQSHEMFGQAQPEHQQARAPPPPPQSCSHLVEGVAGARVLRLHHHIGVQEVGGNHVGDEGRVLVLEDDGHNVVADVPLPLQLGGGGGQEGHHDGEVAGAAAPPRVEGAKANQWLCRQDLLPPATAPRSPPALQRWSITT